MLSSQYKWWERKSKRKDECACMWLGKGAVVHSMTHGMGTVSLAGSLDTSAGCGVPFQQCAQATHKTKDQKYFFTAAFFWVILNPNQFHLLTWTLQVQADLLSCPTYHPAGEGRNIVWIPPLCCFWIQLNFQLQTQAWQSPTRQHLFHPLLLFCAPDTRCWGRSSLQWPFHLPQWHRLSLHLCKTGVIAIK